MNRQTSFKIKLSKYLKVCVINKTKEVEWCFIYFPPFFQNPDYEAGETFFNLTATVMDRDNKYSATTNIQITITDVNDEKPIFKEENVEKSLLEGSQTPVGTVIANFTATDRDNGINGKIKWVFGKIMLTYM